MFVFEFDKDMKVKYFNKIEKHKSTLSGLKLSGQWISRYGYFDYYYSQKLDNDGNFVFFYANNEKDGNSAARRKKPEWVLGIVTYADGEFSYDKLQLSKGDGTKILPGKAKNGYIRLLEVGEKDTEMRLEKINY